MRGYPGVMERKLTQKCPNLVNDEKKALLKVRLTQKWSETKKVNAKMPRNRVCKRQFSTEDEPKI